jgi:hypothetical protein
MKKIIYLIIFLFPLLLSAQEQQKKFGIGIYTNTVNDLPYLVKDPNYSNIVYSGIGISNDNDYSLGLTGNYHLKNDLFLQLNVSETHRSSSIASNSQNSVESTTAPNATHVNISEIQGHLFTQADWSVALGLYYQYVIKKFAIVGGFDIKYIRHGEADYHDSIITTEFDTLSATQISKTVTKAITFETVPKGNAFGIDTHIGLNYFPFKYISVGCEISTALLYTSINGKGTNTASNINTSNDPGTYPYNYKDYSTYPQSYKKFGLDNLQGSLNVIYWF